MKQITRRTILATAPAAMTLAALPVRAAKEYGPGVSDTEVKIGNIMPYSARHRPMGPLAKRKPLSSKC